MLLSRINRLMRFIIPSTLGVCMFLIPFPAAGAANTFVGHIKEYILILLHNYLGVAVTEEDKEEGDVGKPADWAAEAWSKAQSKGVLDGTRPAEGITRQELAVVLDRLGLI